MSRVRQVALSIVIVAIAVVAVLFLRRSAPPAASKGATPAVEPKPTVQREAPPKRDPAPEPPSPPVSVPATPVAEIKPPPTLNFAFTPEQLTAVVAEMFEGMLPALKLTPPQTVLLMNLLEERQAAIVGAVNAAVQRGLRAPGDIDAIAREADAVRAIFDQRVRAQFGDEAFSRYRAWDDGRSERNTLLDYHRQMTDGALALNEAQTGLFLQTLADTKGPYPALTIPRIVYGGMNLRARLSEQTLEKLRASGAFTADQLQHVEQMRGRQQQPPSRPAQ